MIRHIVWWTMKSHTAGQTAADNANFLLEASAELHGNANVKSLEVAAKIEPTSTVKAELVLTCLFDDLAALEAYKADPVHQRFAKLVEERTETRNCLDFLFLPSK